ncbi:MAG: DUF4450 domain-containing protein [Paludibacter sp.]|nr:DUF4450 domain-containing protein [Paludibacter sp.]
MLFLSLQCTVAQLQNFKPWYKQQRELRYKPDKNGFTIVNGTKRFNRALYGTHTGFRVETGDLPEFSLYMPQLGGTIRFGLIKSKISKWLIKADNIIARYEAGNMSYEITDQLLGSGKLNLSILAMADADGCIIKINSENIPADLELFWVFGGASYQRFSRDGDLGADPESSFYLKPENCTTNEYKISNNAFTLHYGIGRSLSDNETYEINYKANKEELNSTRLNEKKQIRGIVSKSFNIHIVNASKQSTPLKLTKTGKSNTPAIAGTISLNELTNYIMLVDPKSKKISANENLSNVYNQAENKRKSIADRIKINTPDEYINSVASTLSTAADAIWDGKSFLHGAIAWRMALNGWRGAYAGDWLGWHDRARTHFQGYFAAQFTEPASGISVPDTATNLARQKEEVGTALYTDGYIGRYPKAGNMPHHYDMNIVFISELLSHFNWTGDIEFLKKSWPVLTRHLAWEKRNFDGNDDGLYDAYCCIWASDALQYNGGGVTHSSAYNYRANKIAAQIAPLVGKDPTPYAKEAEKIKKAMNKQLWMPELGWFAEYKDLLGNQLLHPSAALWTVYHSVDEGAADPFQTYQMTRYVDKYIPQIPIVASGLNSNKYYTIPTTNWMPYTWSNNNVAMAEVLHTALTYWQAGRNDDAYNLTKSTFIDNMFLGSSPGNFGQLSFYDAFRGELYRDFADGIGMASRAFIEGLFGVSPDLINHVINFRPGFPESWNHASIETPDFELQFKKNGKRETYNFSSKFMEPIHLKLNVKALYDQINEVKVNGVATKWTLSENAIGCPEIIIETNKEKKFEVEIEWAGEQIEETTVNYFYALGDSLSLKSQKIRFIDVYDPQGILSNVSTNNNLSATLQGSIGWRTAFAKVQQGALIWWLPISFELRNPIDFVYDKTQQEDKIQFVTRNNTSKSVNGKVSVGDFSKSVNIPARTSTETINISKDKLVPGSNNIQWLSNNVQFKDDVINWHLKSTKADKYESVELSDVYNDRVTNIFNKQYYSPRCPYPTLSIPIQGIGDWCSYNEMEKIDDSGFWNIAKANGNIVSPQGVPFNTPDVIGKNIVFSSKWDNYPDSIEIPLSGKASHIYLLMAGSMHHMQIHMINGEIQIQYTDGSKDILLLKSPDNWWPIEQDYHHDGYAFNLTKPQPTRFYLKTGEWHLDSYNVISRNHTVRIDGGAASMLDLPLNPDKTLSSIKLATNTNDVVIGLMAATLKR